MNNYSACSQYNSLLFFICSKDEIPAMCPPGDIDTVWGITWDLAFTGGMNGQPCPQIEGTTTSGELYA